MKNRVLLMALLAAPAIIEPAREVKSASIEDIATVVVIYAENRGFDNLSARSRAPMASPRWGRPDTPSSIATAPSSRNCRRCGTV